VADERAADAPEPCPPTCVNPTCDCGGLRTFCICIDASDLGMAQAIGQLLASGVRHPSLVGVMAPSPPDREAP
jgi:hypothetical protein